MSEKVEISGDIETPLIEQTKSQPMASWSNISVPGNVGQLLQQQVKKTTILKKTAIFWSSSGSQNDDVIETGGKIGS